MNRLYFLILGILVILVVVFLLINRAQRPTDISEVAVNQLQENQPPITDEDASFLDQLERNAISGGPPKDGIPAIDDPQFTTAAEGDKWLRPDDIIFGVAYDNFVAAFPQRILVWHEISNQIVNGENISVTYCPLTGTTIGFKGVIDQNILTTFGVSGKLVNSNLIMYDRASDSYWPQILGRAINGPGLGRYLEEFPVVWTTWIKWRKKYPDTRVLSRETGFVRDYSETGDPYGSYLVENGGYYTSDVLFFKPINEDDRLQPKTVVVGVRDREGNALAITKDMLRQRNSIEAPLGDKTIVVSYDNELDSHRATIKGTGEWVNSFDAMWFAWIAFYPNSRLIL